MKGAHGADGLMRTARRRPRRGCRRACLPGRPSRPRRAPPARCAPGCPPCTRRRCAAWAPRSWVGRPCWPACHAPHNQALVAEAGWNQNGCQLSGRCCMCALGRGIDAPLEGRTGPRQVLYGACSCQDLHNSLPYPSELLFSGPTISLRQNLKAVRMGCSSSGYRCREVSVLCGGHWRQRGVSCSECCSPWRYYEPATLCGAGAAWGLKDNLPARQGFGERHLP